MILILNLYITIYIRIGSRKCKIDLFYLFPKILELDWKNNKIHGIRSIQERKSFSFLPRFINTYHFSKLWNVSSTDISITLLSMENVEQRRLFNLPGLFLGNFFNGYSADIDEVDP